MSDTKHTPTPWYFGKSTDSDGNVTVALVSDLVVDGKPLCGEAGEDIRGEIVLCSIGGKLSCHPRNADFLERACNCYDALLAACEARAHADRLDDDDARAVAATLTEAAIAKAKEPKK